MFHMQNVTNKKCYPDKVYLTKCYYMQNFTSKKCYLFELLSIRNVTYVKYYQ